MAQGLVLPFLIKAFKERSVDILLAWLAEGYGGGLFTEAGFEREALAHRVNVAISYLVENLRRGDKTYKDVAVLGLRSWLGRWHDLQG